MGIVNTYYLLKKYVDNALSIPFWIENRNQNESAELHINADRTDARNFKYSTDGTTWTATKPDIPAGGRVYIKANATTWSVNGEDIWNAKIGASQQFNVGGNIMSIFYGDYFTGAETTFPDPTKEYILCGMFTRTGVIDASELIIPVQYMPVGACRSFFLECEQLQKGLASLPATQLGHHCYQGMYENCHAMTVANSVLPALHVPQNAYEGMFGHDENFATAPEIMAQTGEYRAIADTFYDCESINAVTVHLTSWNNDVTSGWLHNTASTGVITKPAGLSIPSDSESGCPTGWTTADIQ